jgi:crotonobetainyl-CoA:carnitine CoA-transferase CaiB-like acyl-CoA transferase
VQIPAPLNSPMNVAVNPTVGMFETADGRWINFTMLQPGRYFADVCKHLGLEHLLEDERFQTAEGLMANANEAGQAVADAIRGKPFSYWVEHLQTMEGQWAPVQDPLEVAADPVMEHNGYLLPIVDADGKERKLVASPVQFDETPPTITRGPQFAEHTDDILRELGKSEEEIIQLKIDGAVT